MKKIIPFASILSVCFLLFSVSHRLNAQDNNNSGRNSRTEQFRDMMIQRLKTELKTTDDEWKVIQPLIENVISKQRDAMSSNFGGLGGMMGRNRTRNGQRGQGDDSTQNGQKAEKNSQNTTSASDNNAGTEGNGNSRQGRNRPSSPEMDALKKALESDETSNEEIKAKLAVIHDSREKHQEELKSAREDLRKVLTLKQEAVLVLYGVLD